MCITLNEKCLYYIRCQKEKKAFLILWQKKKMYKGPLRFRECYRRMGRKNIRAKGREYAE
jgi:predicted transcriptional regulator